MRQADPLHYLSWLASRASGILALVLVTLAVLLGLAMAARAIPPGRLKRAAARLHEQLALGALGSISVHGLTLLGDRWLKPGVRGIAIPFAMAYRPAFTGLGIIAGYLVVLLGPSFYLRRRLGPRRWRKVHRLTVVVWVASATHTLGAGSDAGRLWLRALVFLPVFPFVYLLVLRMARPGASRGAENRRVEAVERGRARGDLRAQPRHVEI
jgi:sulfoxide reductase heme-binding subunit YedZ